MSYPGHEREMQRQLVFPEGSAADADADKPGQHTGFC